MSAKLFTLAAISLCLLVRADEPALRLVSPEDGAVFTAGESILLKAETRGAQAATIQKVEFVSRAVIGEATSAPFSFSWKQVPPGVYSLSVRATTTAGLVESWKSTIAVLPSNDPGRVLHVDKNNGSANPNGSATSPYKDIQAAIDAALNGDTIKVAAGEYRG
ncbi:MAG TPA: Ig-like domain-containing protein, partial [Verrucomicrobiae bacterium]|nr:Ig-like domain-containing protein [Verrucomicrobiae bacterium]